MKILFLLLPLFTFGQIVNKQLINIEIGVPFFNDLTSNNKEYTLGVAYINRFSESFSFETFYHFASSSEFPEFYGNQQETLNFYNELLPEVSEDPSSLAFYSLWHKINAHFLGVRIHYSFINSNRWYLSFNIGGGLYNGKSSYNSLDELIFSTEIGKITAYSEILTTKTETKFFFSPSIHTFYRFHKKLHIGLNFDLYSIPIKSGVTDIPVSGDHYNVSLTLGHSF
ncbi:hypothetical protein [Leeuwenhoekiella sp. H156]|uniref:hypothetical protein n=1 Tax=Leeuwenhoekiella sp. H156 TaxID=3450128 RepID=UPI003FA4BA46